MSEKALPANDGLVRGMTELRIIVVFRADLPEMTRAKGEVQFGHAVDGCLESSSEDVAEKY